MAPQQQGARRFHEAGVGSRTGLRLSSVARDHDGFEDLEAFYKASQKAMDLTTIPDDDEEEEEEEDQDDYNQANVYVAGASRSATAFGKARQSAASSSMMDIQDSSAPSPRSTLRKSLASAHAPASQTSDIDYNDIPSSSPSRRSIRSPRKTANTSFTPNTANGDDQDDPLINLSSSGRSFDLGKKPSALQQHQEQERLVSSQATRRAPSSGLAARTQAAKANRHKASSFQNNLSDSDESLGDINVSQGDDYAMDSAEYDTGPPALADTTAEEDEVRAAAAAATTTTKSTSTTKNASKGKAKAKSTPAPRRNGTARSNNFSDDEDQEPVPSQRDSAQPSRIQTKKSAPTQSSQTQRQVTEKINSRSSQPSNIDQDGVRRSMRQRFAPLEWWRGERVRYGRPSFPSGITAEALREEINAATETDVQEAKAKQRRQPVPIIKEVIRIPRAPGEGTFSGTAATTIKKRTKRSGSTQPVSSRKRSKNNAESDEEESYILDPTADTKNPEDGWDNDTSALGLVLDSVTGEEVEKRIACPHSAARPREVFNQNFQFQKVFNCDELMAAGFLSLPKGQRKATKPSKDNNYVFMVLQGAVRVQIHRKTFTMAPGGMFFVPAGNNYSLDNICQRDAKLFFTQYRHPKKVNETDLANASQMSDMTFMLGSQSSSQKTTVKPTFKAAAAVATKTGSRVRRKKTHREASEEDSD